MCVCVCVCACVCVCVCVCVCERDTYTSLGSPGKVNFQCIDTVIYQLITVAFMVATLR